MASGEDESVSERLKMVKGSVQGKERTRLWQEERRTRQ